MPLKKSADSLKKTCLGSICKNFDKWYGINYSINQTEEFDYSSDRGPFTEFPSTLLEDLIESLKEEKRLRRQHLHYLIQPSLRHIDLSYGIGDIYFALQFLSERCHTLVHLNISYQRASPEALLHTLQQLPCLTVLNLTKTVCLDATLGIIGKQCHELKSLNLNLCPVSDYGIMNLCFDRENRTVQCQKLVQLFVSETNVTRQGAAFVLRTLPNLQELQFDALFGLFNDPNLIPMKLKGKTCFNILAIQQSLGDEITLEGLNLAIQLCPLVTHVSVSHWNLSNDALLLLTNLNHLTELFLGNDAKTNLTFYEGILPLLQICGGKLKKLSLSQLFSINLISVNLCCPLLDHLSLGDITYYELSTSEADTPCFINLTYLSIASSDEDDVYPGVFKLLLSHCLLLEEMHVKQCAYFDDVLMHEVLQINPLIKLRKLILEECSYITPNFMLELLSLEGKLKTIRIWSCSLISQNDFQNFLREIKNKNLDVHLDCLC